MIRVYQLDFREFDGTPVDFALKGVPGERGEKEEGREKERV